MNYHHNIILTVQGRLRCLGSSSHLKLRFGGGYLLEVHAADDEALQARLAAFVAAELGGQELEPRHFGRAKFRLPAGCQVGCCPHIASTRTCSLFSCVIIGHKTCPRESSSRIFERRLGCVLKRFDVAVQSMAAIFRLMESAERDLGVTAYGLSMPTLEQVFLSVVGENLQG